MRYNFIVNINTFHICIIYFLTYHLIYYFTLPHELGYVNKTTFTEEKVITLWWKKKTLLFYHKEYNYTTNVMQCSKISLINNLSFHSECKMLCNAVTANHIWWLYEAWFWTDWIWEWGQPTWWSRNRNDKMQCLMSYSQLV